MSNNMNPTATALFIFPCGEAIVKFSWAAKFYGIKHKGSRPIKIEIWGDVSDELYCKSLQRIIHPHHRNNIIVHAGYSHTIRDMNHLNDQ